MVEYDIRHDVDSLGVVRGVRRRAMNPLPSPLPTALILAAPASNRATTTTTTTSCRSTTHTTAGGRSSEGDAGVPCSTRAHAGMSVNKPFRAAAPAAERALLSRTFPAASALEKSGIYSYTKVLGSACG
jgi:hypothetical protein